MFVTTSLYVYRDQDKNEPLIMRQWDRSQQYERKLITALDYP